MYLAQWIDVVDGVDMAVETKENLEKAAAEARTAYENNPSLPNKLDSLYAEAERQFAAGEREEAVKFLKDEVDNNLDHIDMSKHPINDVY